MSAIIVRIEDEYAEERKELVEYQQWPEGYLINAKSIREAILTLQEIIGVDKKTVMRNYMDAKKQRLKKYTGPMYGWDVDKNNNLIPNKDQQLIVNVMKTMYEQGVSLNRIAKTLNERNVKGAKGGKWRAHQVARTVRNDLHDRAKEFEAE